MAAAAASSYLRSYLQGGGQRSFVASGSIIAKGNPFSSASALPSGNRRVVHTEAYEKNPDDGIRPATHVPDDVIVSSGSENHYWAPNPATGVFGPADHHHQHAATHHPAETSAGPSSSVLDQPVWFRAVDGVDY